MAMVISSNVKPLLLGFDACAFAWKFTCRLRRFRKCHCGDSLGGHDGVWAVLSRPVQHGHFVIDDDPRADPAIAECSGRKRQGLPATLGLGNLARSPAFQLPSKQP